MADPSGSQTQANFFAPHLHKLQREAPLELNGQQMCPSQAPYSNLQDSSLICAGCQRQRQAKKMNSTFSFNDPYYQGIHTSVQRQLAHSAIKSAVEQLCEVCGGDLQPIAPAAKPQNFSHAVSQQPPPSNPATVNMIHLRLIQSHNKQSGQNKRENINQVIKDCLTTKKFGPTNNSSSPEKRKAAATHVVFTQQHPQVGMSPAKPLKRKDKRAAPQSHPKSLLSCPPPALASQAKRQSQNQKARENEKTAVLLSRKLAEVDQEFGLLLTQLLHEGGAKDASFENGPPEDTRAGSHIQHLFLKYLGQKLCAKEKHPNAQQALAQQYLNFYNEYAKQESKVMLRQHEYQSKGLQMHKLKAPSPDPPLHKQGRQKTGEPRGKQPPRGPYQVPHVHPSPERPLANCYRNIQTAEQPYRRRVEPTSGEQEKVKFPNIGILNTKEISATQLQLIPAGVSLQTNGVEEELPRPAHLNSSMQFSASNSKQAGRYEGYNQLKSTSQGKRTTLTNNMFTNSYGFHSNQLNQTAYDFNSLDRLDQSRSQKQVPNRQPHFPKQAQFDSPVLVQKFQEANPCISLRIKDEEQLPAPLLKESAKKLFSQMRQTPSKDHKKQAELTKRKNSGGKRTLNYSEQQTRNNAAPYTSSSFFNSGQALLNMSAQSRQSS